MNGVLVFVGAGLGGLARYCTGLFFFQTVSFPFGLATLTVNLLGAAGAGVLFAWVGADFLRNHPLGLFAMTGFLGGFTTFSAFTAENASLLVERPWLALGHALAHVLGCLLVFFMAQKLAQTFFS